MKKDIKVSKKSTCQTSSRKAIQEKKHLSRPARLKGKVHHMRVKKNK